MCPNFLCDLKETIKEKQFNAALELEMWKAEQDEQFQAGLSIFRFWKTRFRDKFKNITNFTGPYKAKRYPRI